jgi:hypothetical protein
MRIDIRKLEIDQVFYIKGNLVKVWSNARHINNKWRIKVVDVVNKNKYVLSSKSGYFFVFEDDKYEEDVRIPEEYKNLLYSSGEDAY